MTLVRDVGRFLERDADGSFVNPAQQGAVQDEWRPALDAVTAACRREAGPAFHSFYVRGSVACGTAVQGSSDLDTVLVLEDGAGERRPDWQLALSERLLAVHPFITDIEVVVLGRGALLAAVTDPRGAGPVMAQWCFLLALWGRCLDGTDLLPALGRFRPGPATAYVLCSLPPDLRRFEQRLAAARGAVPSPSVEADLRRLCVWTCKKLLRAGAELAMLRDGRFTRDLAPCARRFAEHLPPYTDAAHRLLEMAIEPPSDLGVLERMVRELEPVLRREAEAAGLSLEAG